MAKKAKKKHTRSERAAIRAAYDAGWSDGGATNKSNDGWNTLARKYGLKEVR